MKKLIFTLVVTASVALTTAAIADQTKECCQAKAAKVEAKVVQEEKKSCCAAKVEAKVAQTEKKECCQAKVEAKVAQTEKKACCQAKVEAKVAQTEKKDCCAAKVEAKVAQTLPHGKEACCKSTPGNLKVKGEGDCCNAPGHLAKFKVFAEGKYHYFGCEGSATKGRADLIAQGYVGVGKVQKVKGKVAL